MRAFLMALVLSAAGAPALAQIERLPAMSRSERQVIETNRAIQQQQRDLRQDQQTQFEINQLRNQPAIGGPAYPIGPSRGCPPTSIGC